MAIPVDKVYKTVLLMLNKEGRGYMTPDEFNKIATQVQLDIFNKYFEDLNQQSRTPGNDSEFADRLKNIDSKIAVFRKYENISYNTIGGFFKLPDDTYLLGNIFYNGIEIERIDRTELIKIQRSPLTKPTESYPVFVHERYTNDGDDANTTEDDTYTDRIYVYPSSINSSTGMTTSYIATPKDVKWSFTVTSGTYTYASGQSEDFDLHISERNEVVLRILTYAGLVIKDYNLINATASKVQQEEQNQKI